MNYDFPKITHIDDVLPHIKDSPEFIVAEKDGYKVVNYVVATQDTFPEGNPVRRECRGLVFNIDGEIINRRYHKFFNVNERDETQLSQIDWSAPHVILEKLDGSMVTPCYVNGNIRWMTKMGITDTSMEAESFVAQNFKYTYFADEMLMIGMTPIFEWCSNKNRIVLDYPEDRLVLTGLRDLVTGRYTPYNEMVAISEEFDIPVVMAWNAFGNHDILVDAIRQWEGIEGVVVRFDDGHMVKIKSDWYVRIHKVKSLLGQERDVVKLILNNELDDLLPVLPKEDVARVEKFQKDMSVHLRLVSGWMAMIIKDLTSNYDRKTFALEHGPTMNALFRGMVFKFWDKECDEHLTYAAIVDIILKNCGNNASYAKVKEAFLEDVNYV